MPQVEILKKFIKARDRFGEAVTKSGEQYIKAEAIQAKLDDDEDAGKVDIKSEAEEMEAGVDYLAPLVIRTIKWYEHENDELVNFAKKNPAPKVATGQPAPPAPQPDTTAFAKAAKNLKVSFTNFNRAIYRHVINSELAKDDSSGRFVRAGKEFLDECNEIMAAATKNTNEVLKKAGKEVKAPDLPPSDFQGDFRKVLKSAKLDMDAPGLDREIKEADARFKKLDSVRLYEKFQEACKPAMAALEELVDACKKYDPKKLKLKKDEKPVDDKITDNAAKQLQAFAKKVDEYDDRIFAFSRLH